jgi:hypothetical protein
MLEQSRIFSLVARLHIYHNQHQDAADSISVAEQGFEHAGC